ncbi:hypothetical protein HNR42_002619 [Deinobacterium chartae]|uniref:Lipoprotein n=1 Tax=Deinobacterium chartae TaxID=521158 RepID=A0A841I1Q8_9DEIO|nr:hypothetical protein [Deinobacterium chartae]MBB6099183.1 hypothetical protein [Deinobacterium chartae]
MNKLLTAALLMLGLTGCTGTQEPAEPLGIVVSVNEDGTDRLKRISNLRLDPESELYDPANPIDLSVDLPAPPVGLANTPSNDRLTTLLLVGFAQQLVFYDANLKPLASPHPLTVPDGKCLESFQVTLDTSGGNPVLSALIDNCGAAPNDFSGQALWVYALAENRQLAVVNNPAPDSAIAPYQPPSNVSVYGYTASRNRLFFTQQRLGTSYLYEVNLNTTPLTCRPNGETLPCFGQPLNGRIYDVGLYANGGVMALEDGVYPIAEGSQGTRLLEAPVRQLLGSPTLLIGYVPNNSRFRLLSAQATGSIRDVYLYEGGARDLTISSDGYAWFLNGSALYRADVAGVREDITAPTPMSVSLSNPRFLSWVQLD